MEKFINPQAVEQLIQSKLYKFNAAKELAWAYNSGENCILFGPGGYGKSDAAIMFADYLKQVGHIETSPYVMAFGQGMTEERLLGGLDIKKFQDTGEILYLLANAFVSYEVVIFEELWDAFPAVLLVLKDILQSKTVRMGAQVMPIKTKLVIACTNRSREEVVSDNSTEALMQRFLFEKEVAWTSWEASDYLKAFQAATGLEGDANFASVAICCAEASKGEHKISPRTAGKALKSVRINGLESMRGMFGFDKAVEAELKVQDSRKQDALQLAAMQATVGEIKNLVEKSRSLNSGIRIAEVAKQASLKLSIFSLEVRDANVEASNKLLQTATSFVEKTLLLAAERIVNPKQGSFAAELKAQVEQKNFEAALALVKVA